jgi:DNA-binding MarR family transcriptional regulator
MLELARISADRQRSGALAADLGLSPEATYRSLARLERTGLLQRERGDRARLPMSAAA